jgi:hypothetical protein
MDSQAVSDHAPDLAPRVAAMVMAAPPLQRERLLNALLRPLGPLALVSVAAGAFAGLLPSDRWRAAHASREQAMRVDATQVLALVVYVEQKSPEVLLGMAMAPVQEAAMARPESGASV